MTTTTGQALARMQENPAVVLRRQYAGRLASLVPTHVNGEAWVRQATGTLRDDKLREAAQADFGSFVAAVERAAVLGLRPGTEEYYLQPRKIKGRLQVQGIVGYQGLIDLMYRSGAVASVVVEAVRRADVFTYMPGRDHRPMHEIDWDAEDRGDLRLVYAYAVMQSGSTSKVVVINRAKMYAEHRAKSEGLEKNVWENGRAVGKTVNDQSPWYTNEEAMWLKTAARQLAKWVPTSTEYIAQQAQAHAVAASVVQRTEGPAPAVQPALSAQAAPAIESAVSRHAVELLDDDPNSQWDDMDGAEAAAEGQP